VQSKRKLGIVFVLERNMIFRGVKDFNACLAHYHYSFVLLLSSLDSCFNVREVALRFVIQN